MNQNIKNTGWEGILDADEDILWQGRPDGTFRLTIGAIGGAIFGVFFAGFAVIWMVLASSAGGIFWMFGLIHFSVGIGVIFSSLFWATWRRRHTWYTLSTKRAFIAEDIPLRGRKLKSYPITGYSPLNLIQGERDTVNFATTTVRNRNRSREVAVGFEEIEDGTKVLGLMRQVKQAEAARDA